MVGRSTTSQLRTCIFCGGSPTTAEHVLRSDFRKYFPEHSAHDLISETAPHRNTKRPTSMFDRTVRAACANCNNNWMNQSEADLEYLLTPLFEGAKRRITRPEVRDLAFWAATRAAVRSQVEPLANRVDIAEYARAIYASRRPPDGTTLWLGFSDEPLILDIFRSLTYRVKESNGSVRANHVFFQHTIGLGRALFVVVGTSSPALSSELYSVLGESVDDVLAQSAAPLTRLWPHPTPVRWPGTPMLPTALIARDLCRLAEKLMFEVSRANGVP